MINHTGIGDMIGLLKQQPSFEATMRSRLSPQRWWTELADRLIRFESVLNSISQVHPVGCIIWGGLKAIIHVSCLQLNSLPNLYT